MSSYVKGGEYLTPTGIHADRAAGTLEVSWADGHRSVYDTVTLRWLCPCAFCRGEAGMPGWLDSKPVLSPEQTRLVDIQLVGQYAVCPTWADGHATGFYTFERLRDACPCPEDTARRAAHPHAGHS
ncbi:MAG: gamma-butyrobetaine hydroxylase-like domain-containing protein [Candidatus Limnocylindrales bacterium]